MNLQDELDRAINYAKRNQHSMSILVHPNWWQKLEQECRKQEVTQSPVITNHPFLTYKQIRVFRSYDTEEELLKII